MFLAVHDGGADWRPKHQVPFQQMVTQKRESGCHYWMVVVLKVGIEYTGKLSIILAD